METAGRSLRAPSELHAFNRYEIKYLVDVSAVDDLRRRLAERLDHDADYPVWSLYYDTQRLRFYWEKVEGLRFRRKLRLRHYGPPSALTDDGQVFVEIKQRVNRVTQKRRVALPYATARQLCDAREPVPHSPAQRGFVEEVLGLVSGLDLRPTTVTGYHREAYAGRGAELGLRVTIDQRVRGRDRDLRLDLETENRFIVPPARAIVEVKANERVPSWFTDLAAERSLSVVRISKYCQSVEVFGRAPRSVFHVHETDPGSAPDPAPDPQEVAR